MTIWNSLLALIVLTTAGIAGVALWRRMPIYLLLAMVLTHVCGLLLFLAGLVQWVLDPFAAIGEYGDGGDMSMVAPLIILGGVLLAGAWIPALGGRARRSA